MSAVIDDRCLPWAKIENCSTCAEFVIPALKHTSVKEQVALLQSFITNPMLCHILFKFSHTQTPQTFPAQLLIFFSQLSQVCHISFKQLVQKVRLGSAWYVDVDFPS